MPVHHAVHRQLLAALELGSCGPSACLLMAWISSPQRKFTPSQTISLAQMQTQVLHQSRAATSLAAVQPESSSAPRLREDGGKLPRRIASAHDHPPATGQMCGRWKGPRRASDGMLHARNDRAGWAFRLPQSGYGGHGWSGRSTSALCGYERRTAMDKAECLRRPACGREHRSGARFRGPCWQSAWASRSARAAPACQPKPPGLLGQLAEVRGMARQLLGDAAPLTQANCLSGQPPTTATISAPQAGNHRLAHAARTTAYDQKNRNQSLVAACPVCFVWEVQSADACCFELYKK